jgi:hypothetical protein
LDKNAPTQPREETPQRLEGSGQQKKRAARAHCNGSSGSSQKRAAKMQQLLPSSNKKEGKLV